MAGLPGRRAWVWVGPPLSARGPSRGLMMPWIGPPMRLPLASGEPTGASVRSVPVLSPMRL